MKPELIKNILFDLDGTLTDPVEGITRCINYALERMSAPVPTRAELQTHIGPPLRSTFSSLMQTSDETLVERAVWLYRERFADVGMFENEIYDGVPEMLAQLQALGKRLFVATSKVQLYTGKILEHFNLSTCFEGVYGSELNGKFDNKADLIRHILAGESLRPDETLMVGDRKYDILGAKENLCAAAGVTYGYGSMEELLAAGADYLCGSPAQVVALLTDGRAPLRAFQ
jgi:phosphoglycolate phosphatase